MAIEYTNPVFIEGSAYRNESHIRMPEPAEYSGHGGNYEACSRVYAQFADSARQSACTGNYSAN